MNIYELIRGRRHYVAEERVKRYMYQLVKSMDHMHRNGIFHRDIKAGPRCYRPRLPCSCCCSKSCRCIRGSHLHDTPHVCRLQPENILIMDDCLKLADFGSCRGIYSKQPYTEYISTRWYR